jgi:hypothetical protein
LTYEFRENLSEEKGKINELFEQCKKTENSNRSESGDGASENSLTFLTFHSAS